MHALAGLAAGATTAVSFPGLILCWLAAIWSLVAGPVGRELTVVTVVVALAGSVLLLWWVQGLGGYDGSRFRAVLGVEIPAPPGRAAGGQLRPLPAWQAPATWRQLGYHLLAMTGGTAGATGDLLVGAALAAAYLAGSGAAGAEPASAWPCCRQPAAGRRGWPGPWPEPTRPPAEGLLGPSRGEELAMRSVAGRSRAEIVAPPPTPSGAGSNEDLHDSTQRRLVSWPMHLGMAGELLTDAPSRSPGHRAGRPGHRGLAGCASVRGLTRPCSTTGA